MTLVNLRQTELLHLPRSTRSRLLADAADKWSDAMSEPKPIGEMDVAELEAEIQRRDVEHKRSQKHLKALLRCLQDTEPTDE